MEKSMYSLGGPRGFDLTPRSQQKKKMKDYFSILGQVFCDKAQGA